MTAAVLERRPEVALVPGPAFRPAPVRAWYRQDHVVAQFARFVLVGGSATVVHVGLFLVLAGVGEQAANLAGVVTSTALANELHRRLTFRAADRTGWAAAQWAGGGIAVTGLVASSSALAALAAWTAAAGPSGSVLVVCAVNGAVGLARFVGLRWVLAARHRPRWGSGIASAATVRSVSTSVVLSVTPREPVDPDRYTGEVPDDIAAALTSCGQPVRPGLWCPRSGPVRLLFELSGADRVAAGQRLLGRLLLMGYEAKLSFSP
jgi:putative flippase GtrA